MVSQQDIKDIKSEIKNMTNNYYNFLMYTNNNSIILDCGFSSY